MIAKNGFVNRVSWIKSSENTDFSIFNIPFGIAKFPNGQIGAVSRIDDMIINLHLLARDGYFDAVRIQLDGEFNQLTLNEFIARGKNFTSKVRERIQHLLSDDNNEIADRNQFMRKYLNPVWDVKLLFPLKVTDYTDFYSSIEHATNVGSIFRDPKNALLPNWRHLPIGYHGRTSSLVVSGTNIHRPMGQILPQGADKPVFSATKMLDFELEMAFVVGKSTELGNSVNVQVAEEYIFGFVLFNDLSARDIQSWEYVPLGPFLSKNFGSIISPWIVTLEALEPFRTEGPLQEPEVLDYLKIQNNRNFDINLEVSIKPGNAQEALVSATNFKYMYWNICQQLAHHTVNGCNISVGDLYASGTISGPVPGSYGSLLELTWRGKNPVRVGEQERTFLQDYDTVVMRGFAKKDSVRVGFGECETTILPAKNA